MDPGGCPHYHYAMLSLMSTHIPSSHSIKLVIGRSIFTVHCFLCKSSLCLTGIWVPRAQQIHRKISHLGQSIDLSLAVRGYVSAPAFFSKQLLC